MNAKNFKPFEILNSWQQHLNRKNLSGVLKLYDLNCVLIPTFSSEILSDHEQIKKYFFNVIEIQKSKVEFQPYSISEQQVGDGMYLLSGKYCFHLMGKEKIPSRFSFLVNLLNEYPILHHHSSRSISNPKVLGNKE
tara:strand:- start:23 stop:430 length:408 start_codon:yes stop_codon:yes gene_type:complete